VPALLAAVVVLALAVGCGKELDASGPEQAIANAVGRNYGVVVTDVICPEDIDAKQGATFDCIVVLRDDRLSARVTQTDDDGRVEYELVQQILTRKSVTNAIAKEFNARAVECGRREYWVSHPGESFRCRATDETGGEGVIVVTIRDTKGNLDLDLADA
jgi:hypothetical protein